MAALAIALICAIGALIVVTTQEARDHESPV